MILSLKTDAELTKIIQYLDVSCIGSKIVEEYLFIMSLNNSNNLIPIQLNLLFSDSRNG